MSKFTYVIAATLGLILPLGGAALAADDAAPDMEFEITGDAEKGEKAFRKCKACHDVGEGAQNKVGPMLNGILGKAAGSDEDYKYSSAFMEKVTAEELVWTPETLSEFLTKPRDYINGTKMAFAGLRKEEDRNDVIAYLATFKDEATE